MPAPRVLARSGRPRRALHGSRRTFRERPPGSILWPAQRASMPRGAPALGLSRSFAVPLELPLQRVAAVVGPMAIVLQHAHHDAGGDSLSVGELLDVPEAAPRGIHLLHERLVRILRD